jgi:hypothetical protein
LAELQATGRLTAKRLLEIPLIPDPGWPEWFKLAGIPNAKPKFGAALLSPALFVEPIAQGVLTAPFSWAIEGRGGYRLLWDDEAPECRFVRWIKSQCDIGLEPPSF